MEPLTAVLGAYAAIKTGVKAGRDIQALAGDIGKLFDGIDDVRNAHSKKKGKASKGVNEEALETFMAAQKAKDIEDELRQIIIYSRGMNAWQELIRIRGQIRKQRIEDARQRKRQLEQYFEYALIGVLVIGCLILLSGFVFFVGAERKWWSWT